MANKTLAQLGTIASSASDDRISIWDESASQHVTITRAQLATDIAAAIVNFVKADGSITLTADWDIGAGKAIEGDTIRARSASGLQLHSDGGSGATVQDDGDLALDQNLVLIAGKKIQVPEVEGLAGADLIIDSAAAQDIDFRVGGADGIRLSTNNSLEPNASNTHDLGRSSQKWNNGHINTVHAQEIKAQSSAGLLVSNLSGVGLLINNSGNMVPDEDIQVPGGKKVDTPRVRGLGGGNLDLEAQGLFNIILTSNGGQRVQLSTNNSWEPVNTGGQSLGRSSNKWSDVWANNGTIQTSDPSEKKFVKESDLGLEFILALRPIKWVWKKDGKRPHYGLNAEQVKEAMDTQKVEDFAGYIKDAETGGEALRYTEFIGPIVKAMQEMAAKIERLEAQLAAQ